MNERAEARRSYITYAIAAAVGLSTWMMVQPGQAQECPNRGDLDQAYCDADGDLVADTPDEVVDPNTLVFAYTPVEDPAIYEDIWMPFIEHLEEVTGKDVQFFAVQSNSAQVRSMRRARLHVWRFST